CSCAMTTHCTRTHWMNRMVMAEEVPEVRRGDGFDLNQNPAKASHSSSSSADSDYSDANSRIAPLEEKTNKCYRQSK
ncbi:hypothetical protein PIB30_100382, partial [Stylosanthes scabra]|nr:hypothetical protein [Stylosanthes scabra]